MKNGCFKPGTDLIIQDSVVPVVVFGFGITGGDIPTEKGSPAGLRYLNQKDGFLNDKMWDNKPENY